MYPRGMALELVPPDGLQDKRYVTVILRLLIDRHGALVHGELADIDGRAGTRFVGWPALTPAVHGWVTSHEHDE